jgi:glutamate formiminotransferase/formiminotetrahydrofolate cyclodeaminase
MNDQALVECVPNFSEGRDRQVIESIGAAIKAVPGLTLLDIDPGADTNRTVYTFVGSPSAVLSGALAGARAARPLIDMRTHSGAHPRIGALDVCPFVPVSGISMEECVELSKEFGRRLSEELGVPVYLYEKAAKLPYRTSLADIRSGEYEGLCAKLLDPEWLPDFGSPAFDPRWGATVTGAREFLVAYNVNLNTRDKKLAGDIAMAIREGGRLARDSDGRVRLDEKGQPAHVAGRLKAVRAIGWYIEQYRCAQVSINLLDFKTTPLYEVFETVCEEAELRGLRVTGSELVGLLPLEAIAECGRHFLAKAGKSPGLCEAELVELAVSSMGLNSVSRFEASKKIVERACKDRGRLQSLSVSAFADELSSDSPAPGGGSAAALAGSLGSALAAMVGNLTVGKKGYEDAAADLATMAVDAQKTKDLLLQAIDLDTRAFNAILEATRLPKSTEAQAGERNSRLDAALREAAAVPMDTARLCLQALEQCLLAIEKGNRNSVTDGAAGILLAHAGLEAALLNVRINLKSISDKDYVKSSINEAAGLKNRADELKRLALAALEKTLGL